MALEKEMLDHPFKGKIHPSDLDEIEALLILTSLPSIGNIRILQLIEHFGSALDILCAPKESLLKSVSSDSKAYESLSHWKKSCRWQENIELIEKFNVDLISYKSKKYPKSLLASNDFPLLLYAKGSPALQIDKAIAIVGTRNASIYGKEMGAYFAKELAAQGYTIISGLARGIDTAAHLGALQSGKTVAVIGSGLANIYPKENRSLAEEIAFSGCIFSEFPMGTPPDRQNFPQRNRIVSGMADAILLIEAPMKSGAMNTMNLGIAKNKKLFALPGRIDNEGFCGNHYLIKHGHAKLVENPYDILADLSGELKEKSSNEAKFCGILLDKDEMELLRSLPMQEISIEEILLLAKMPINRLNALLMSLLLKGVIKEFPGRIYKKIGMKD